MFPGNRKPTPTGFILRDDFTDTLAAGAVNGTVARPSGSGAVSQVRTVTDTNGKISQANGVLNFATGAAVNDGVWRASHARVAGRAAFFKIVPADTAGIIVVGYDANQSGTIFDALQFSTTTGIRIAVNGGATYVVTVGAYAANTTYYVCAIMRDTGIQWLIKGGTYTNWTLLLLVSLNNTARFPAIAVQNATSVFTAGLMRTADLSWLAPPCISDGFGGLVTVSDGLGHAEGLSTTSDVGKGGSGQARLSPATWANAAGVTVCTPIGGTLDELVSPILASQPNVWAEIKLTAFTTGRAGMMLNIDVPALPLNGLMCYHNGTQIVLSKYVASAETALLTVADVYAANVKLIVHKLGTAIRVYKETAAGVVTLIGAATTVSNTNCYMSPYSDNAGNTLDNFVVIPNGMSGEYEARLNQYIA